MRIRIRKVLTIIFALFLFPLAVHAALYASKDRPASFRDADWSSVGMLPPATADRDARLLVFTGRTGRWKGIFAVHSWVVFKPENAATWSRYDVVGWGQPVRSNGWAPDGRWFGDTPRVLVDVRGAGRDALIPKVKAAIADYNYKMPATTGSGPGRTATPSPRPCCARCRSSRPRCRRTRSARTFRPGLYAGLTDSRTGVEASSLGSWASSSAGSKAWRFNFLGLVAGLDVRHPAVKLPGFGRLGLDDGTAIAAPAAAK